MLHPTGTGACLLQDQLLRRAGIGVGFDFVALFLDDPTQFALHGFEGVVDHFAERRMGAVVHSLFVRDDLMPGRNGDIDPDPKRVSFLMRVIRLLDRDVAAVDVIAKLFEVRCLIQD